MSVFVTVAAVLKVKTVVLAETPEQGVAQAKDMLRACRVVPAVRRSWLQRLAPQARRERGLPVAEVVAAEAVASSYAGGE